jgi:hypothetical protein
MLPDIQALPDGKFWFWALALSTLSATALYFAFRNLARARIIEDTPTSRVRSAHQGYVELAGAAAAMQGEPILSPLTMTPCCWFRYKVERKRDKGWATVRSGKSDGLFLLRDETGECVIDPDGAEITSKEKSVWYGPSATPTVSPKPGPHKPGGMHGILGLTANINIAIDGQYRYTEEAIYPGDRLYAIGLFKSFGETDRMVMREERIKARLSQWKRDHTGLLDRFDRDGDGAIDLTEWEVARRAASREVTKEQMQEDQQPLHTLSRTVSRRHPFLISAYEEYDLVKRFRYLSVGSIGGFFLCGAGAVWLFASRFIL